MTPGGRTRSIPPSVRRALGNRDRGCRFPGCTATHRLHGHHVRHWANGGDTSLDNLILLCRTHHRLVHEGGFDVQRLDDGAFRFTNPHGLAIRPPRRHSDIFIPTPSSSAERIPRPRHRLRDRDRALARGAHRLRPCADGGDGVVGFRATPDRRRDRRPGTGIRRRSTRAAVSSRDATRAWRLGRLSNQLVAWTPSIPWSSSMRRRVRVEGDVGKQVAACSGTCSAIGRRDAGLSFVISY